MLEQNNDSTSLDKLAYLRQLGKYTDSRYGTYESDYILEWIGEKHWPHLFSQRSLWNLAGRNCDPVIGDRVVLLDRVVVVVYIDYIRRQYYGTTSRFPWFFIGLWRLLQWKQNVWFKIVRTYEIWFKNMV